MTLRLSILLALLLTSMASAQEGKPLYEITAIQGGDTLGVILVELYPDIAPLHVRNFDSLVAIGFYDSTAFHRVVPSFVIQGGDPNSRSGPEGTWGYGDPSQTTVRAEFSVLSHTRGAFSAARAHDPNSATSQFFIVHQNATTLDRLYSIYGRALASSLSVVDVIVSAPVVPETERPQVKIEMFIRRVGTDTSAPSAPSPMRPVDDTTRVSASVTLGWAKIPEAVLYQVEVARDADFTELVIHDSVIVTSYTATKLELGEKTFYWRVRASNGGRRGEWSEVRRFTTSMAAPQLLAPTSGDTVDLPVLLVWSSVPGAASYALQIGTTLSMATLVLDSSAIADTSAVVLGLAPGRYYWRVLADNGRYTVPANVRWSFVLRGPSAVGAERAAAESLTMAAQLKGNELSIRIASSRASKSEVIIVDLEGRELVKSDVDLLRGIGVAVLDVEALPAGHYFIVANAAGEVCAERIFVVR